MVDAAGDESVALVEADIDQALAQFDASQAYSAATQPLYHAMDDALRGAEKAWAKKQRTQEKTRSHEQELSQKDYDVAYAGAVKVQAVAEATADKSYYVDLYGEVADGFSWAAHQLAYVDAALAFAGSVGDADVAWTGRVAAAGKAKKLALAPDQQAYKLALAGAEKALSDGLAYADEAAAIAQAPIQTAYWAAETAAAGTRHVAEAESIAWYRTGDYAGQTDSWVSVASAIGTPWAQYQASLAGVKETWWQGASIRQVDLAQAEADADNAYEATVDQFYADWVEDTAEAQRIFDLAAADLAYARASDEGDGEHQYVAREAELEETYQNALAAQRKQSGIESTRLAHDLPLAPYTVPSDHTSAAWEIFLVDQDRQATDALKLDYQRTEVVAAGVEAISGDAHEIGHVDQEESNRLAFVIATSGSDSAYTQVEATANAARLQALATNEAARDLADVESYALALASFAQANPSPWSSQAAAEALADAAKAQVTLPTVRDKFIAEVNSDRDLAIAGAQAQQTLAAENFAAASAQRVSQTQQNQQQLLTKTNGANPTPLDAFALTTYASGPIQPVAAGNTGNSNLPTSPIESEMEAFRLIGRLFGLNQPDSIKAYSFYVRALAFVIKNPALFSGSDIHSPQGVNYSDELTTADIEAALKVMREELLPYLRRELAAQENPTDGPVIKGYDPLQLRMKRLLAPIEALKDEMKQPWLYYSNGWMVIDGGRWWQGYPHRALAALERSYTQWQAVFARAVNGDNWWRQAAQALFDPNSETNLHVIIGSAGAGIAAARGGQAFRPGQSSPPRRILPKVASAGTGGGTTHDQPVAKLNPKPVSPKPPPEKAQPNSPPIDKPAKPPASDIAPPATTPPTGSALDVAENIPENAPRSATATIATSQLEKKWKHASDFGITTPKRNPATLGVFGKAIASHLDDAATVKKGTYLYVPDSVVFFNPNTNLVVVLDKNGNFVTGWKLLPGTRQFEKYIKDGVLR